MESESKNSSTNENFFLPLADDDDAGNGDSKVDNKREKIKWDNIKYENTIVANLEHKYGVSRDDIYIVIEDGTIVYSPKFANAYSEILTIICRQFPKFANKFDEYVKSIGELIYDVTHNDPTKFQFLYFLASAIFNLMKYRTTSKLKEIFLLLEEEETGGQSNEQHSNKNTDLLAVSNILKNKRNHSCIFNYI